MSMISLHPNVILSGFQEVACVTTSRPLSPMPDFNEQREACQSNDKMANTPIEAANELAIHQEDDNKTVDSVSVESVPDGRLLQREISIDTMACKLCCENTFKKKSY
jgi:hypothetical protein